ncbi:hypothetical protein CHS0354_027651 [Potamilus streckersoni]|uniref:RNA helicase n=1 Tax=Potamilus streckersoni TaxID=2493646 RepID=A0AAE0T0D9_9BIVA|nr:hypothetical protein CHS0354_027651 [Potamilus streckersoni]
MADWDDEITNGGSSQGFSGGFGNSGLKGFGRGTLRQASDPSSGFGGGGDASGKRGYKITNGFSNGRSENEGKSSGLGGFRKQSDDQQNVGRGFGKSSFGGRGGGFGQKLDDDSATSSGGFEGRGFQQKSEGSNSESSGRGFGKKLNDSGVAGSGFGGGFAKRSEDSTSGGGGGFGGRFGKKSDDSISGSGGFGRKSTNDDSSESDRPPRGGGFGGGSKSGGSACFKCGEDGHMSRECPNSEKKSGCYKCGEDGHMARECPDSDKKGGGGGSGGCYKCGESGHFAKECPSTERKGITLDKGREAPYVPPAPTDDEEEIFKSITKGINFDNFDKIPVEVTGQDAPSRINSFDEAGLYDAFLKNVRKAGFEKPTPVQKFSIPIIMAGRDLMACAQTGSGKTAAFLLPVLTGMMKSGLSSSQFSTVQEPQALVVAPTRELALQIFMDARKFAHGTMLRSVVVYGGTSVGYQMRQLEQGTHILVGTPGRLLDVLGKQKVSLEKIKYLILDEADRMLDMGFGPEVRKIVEDFGMPPKNERQTLMFSATFPEEIQKLAAEFLNDYLFLSVGRTGGANTDVSQMICEVDRQQKRQKLCDILTDIGSEKTLVFVEQKRNADFLASFLSESGFPTTSIHGDRLQREREEALKDFKTGRAPILIATSVAARGLDIPAVKYVINYDLPQTIEEYVHRIGRTGRCGNLGEATSFYSHDTDSGIAKALVRVLADANQDVPEWLEKYAKDSVSTAGYIPLGHKFGGKDIRKGIPKSEVNAGFDSSNGFGGFGGGLGSFGGSSGFSANAGGDEESWD